MNKNHIIIHLLLLFALGLSLVSCGGEDEADYGIQEKLYGQWKLTKGEGYFTTSDKSGRVVEWKTVDLSYQNYLQRFSPDGKWSSNVESAKYTVNGKKVTITWSDGDKKEFTVESITDSEAVFKYSEKKKDGITYVGGFTKDYSLMYYTKVSN